MFALLRHMMAQIVKGVKGGIPVISCHMVSTKELAESSMMKTQPDKLILVGLNQRNKMGFAGPSVVSICVVVE